MISSFFTIPDVLTTTECQQIINYCADKCKPSTLGEMSIKVDSVEDIRNSVNTFIRPEDINQLPVIRKLTDCMVKLSLQCYNFSISYIEPVQYAEYTEGMYYKPHTDSGETFECDRDISASVFLILVGKIQSSILSGLYFSTHIKSLIRYS